MIEQAKVALCCNDGAVTVPIRNTGTPEAIYMIASSSSHNIVVVHTTSRRDLWAHTLFWHLARAALQNCNLFSPRRFWFCPRLDGDERVQTPNQQFRKDSIQYNGRTRYFCTPSRTPVRPTWTMCTPQRPLVIDGPNSAVRNKAHTLLNMRIACTCCFDICT